MDEERRGGGKKGREKGISFMVCFLLISALVLLACSVSEVSSRHTRISTSFPLAALTSPSLCFSLPPPFYFLLSFSNTLFSELNGSLNTRSK